MNRDDFPEAVGITRGVVAGALLWIVVIALAAVAFL